MKRFRSTPLLLLVVLSLSGFQKPGMPVYQTGTLKIRFINTVKGKPVQLDSTVYTNPFSETYTITKFKYYISNMAVAFPDGIFKETDSYHLVDEGNPVSLSFVFLTVRPVWCIQGFRIFSGHSDAATRYQYLLQL